MPHFLTLEDYEDPQKMRKVLKGLREETLKPLGIANLCLSQLVETRLKVAWLEADALRRGGLATHDTRPPANLSIQQRANFFEQNTPQKLKERQKILNDRVVEYRKWLSRQGASFRNNYEIDHAGLKNKVVKYDFELSKQGATKVTIAGNQILTHDNQLLDTKKMVTHHSGPGFAIYVISGEGNFHVASHKVGQYHHSSILAGGKVACAGEMKVTNGILSFISNKSGHYRPDNDDLLHALAILQKNGNSMHFAVNRLAANNKVEKYPSVDAFLTDIGQDDETVLRHRKEVAEILASAGGGGGGGYSGFDLSSLAVASY